LLRSPRGAMQPKRPAGDDGGDAEATRAESPSARGHPLPSPDAATLPALSRASPSGDGSKSGHSATAARAIRNEELMRARGFARMIAVLSAAALVPTWLVSRQPTATPGWLQALTAAALASAAVAALWVW